MTVYCDLDGPILDVSHRYWQIHRDVLTKLGSAYLSRRDYWHLKRMRKSTSDILARVNAQNLVGEYTEMRLACIEKPKYLEYDRVCPGARLALTILKRNHRLVLMTLRCSVEALHGELRHLELVSLFDRILSSGEQRIPRWGIKVDLIHSDGYQDGTPGVIIGDSESDIVAGKQLGLRTVGISCGIRTEDLLVAMGADAVFPSLVQFVSGEK